MTKNNKEVIEELRDLYLTTTPDKEENYTKSILFTWGKFEFNPTTIKKVEFYLTTKNAIEVFLLQALVAQKQKLIDIVEGGITKIKPGHGTCCTCQECGYCHEDCKCEQNRILSDLSTKLKEL